MLALRSAIPLAVAALAPAALAQSPLPDPHWGANIFPQGTPEIRSGLYFNRFTEFDGDGERFNDIDETAGINFLVLSYTDRLAAYPSLSYAVHGGIGVTNDQPTEFFQNEFVHDLLGLDTVDVVDDREESEFVGGLSLTRWYQPAERWTTFLGGGISSGTLYSEPYVHAGGTYDWDPRNLRLGLMLRSSTPVGGDAYPDVASSSSIVQASIAHVPDRIESDSRILNFLGNPEIGMTLTWDSGLFEDKDGDAIDIFFLGFRVKWATGLTFETWNDTLNDSDFGPTYGFMVSIDLATFFRLNT